MAKRIACLCGEYRNQDRVCKNPDCALYNKYTTGMHERGVTPQEAGVPAVTIEEAALPPRAR